ncbi:MAG TPA: hypothetical protein VGI79_10310 [Caulobacteraceae bacterium]|jgi:hypothetical protein
MIAAALSLALLSGLLPQHTQSAHAQPAMQRAQVEGWTYEVRTDAFTGGKTCKLYARDPKSRVRMTYVSGAVAFQFAHSLDTRSAVYRVDGGAARASRDDVTALAVKHVVTPDPLLNQSAQGLVFIPDDILLGAHEVSIRPSPYVSPKTVGLGGLQQAVAAVQAQGCAPTSFAQFDVNE